MDAISLIVIVGLWQVRFSDGTSILPEDCSVHTNAQGVIVWESPSGKVEVETRPCECGVDFVGRITPKGKTVVDFLLPARSVFRPDDVDRVTFPGDRMMGAGYSLKSDFFRRQSDLRLCAWKDEVVAGMGYRDVVGGD